jgi:thiol-disulfide isomerase/thioredoxin
MNYLNSILFSLLIFLLVLGCGKKAQDSKNKRINSLLEKTNFVQSVDSIDSNGFSKLIQNRNGKVLFLNIWATWCLPCIEEFPDIIKLSKSFENQNLEVVGISVDYPDEVQSKIIPFLKKHEVPFKVFVANFAKDEELINMLDKKWNGAIPATFIIDTEGKQQFSFIGKGKYEMFRNKIESLLTTN